MTDHMKSPDDPNPPHSTQASMHVKNKKTLDTFFPSKWLLFSMVVVVFGFNIITGIKVFTLQKEKAVIEILKARYESYEKIIGEVEEKEERLRTLTQQIVPLEMRRDNAEKTVAGSNEKLEQNKAELNEINAMEAEIDEKLKAAYATIAKLSNDKQNLRGENLQLQKIVGELRIDEEKTEQRIKEKKQELRLVEENIAAAEIRLKDQEKYLEEVTAANSSFEDLKKQLAEFVKKMEETQSSAGRKIESLTEVITGIAEQKNQLTSNAKTLALETGNFAQSNAIISVQVEELNTQNRGYKAELDKAKAISGDMKTVAAVIKGSAASLETEVKDLDETVTEVTEQKNKLISHTKKIALESESFAQSNTVIIAQVEELNSQNEDYKTEVEKARVASGEMKTVAEAIKESTASLEMDEALIAENSDTIKSTVQLAETASKELVQISKQFAVAVAGVTSQREKLDAYLQEISDLPNMDDQVTAFNQVLNDISDVAQLLSEKVSAIQSSFNGKINGMELSFGTLEKDFTELSLKIDGVEQALQKIASRAQKMDKESPKI